MLFEERVQLRIFGPKRVEVTGEWRKLRKKMLYNLCFTSNIIREIKSRRKRSAKRVARMEERRGAYRLLVRKSGGKRTLGKFRRRLEDNTGRHKKRDL